MRLLHVTTVPMTLTFLRGQVGYMKSRGVEVHALSSPGGQLSAFAAAEGVAAHDVEMPRRITPARDLVALARIARVLARVRPDVVHSHTPKGGLLGMLAAWLCRVPVRVYHLHGLPHVAAVGMKRRLLRATEKVSCRLAHRVFCVSPSLLQLAVAEQVCAPRKARVLAAGSANGVDAAGRFDPARHDRRAARAALALPADGLVVGFVGRVVRDKGVVELAGAWRWLRERFPGARLLIVGPLEPQDPVPRDVLQSLRSDPRVLLAGERDDTPPLYAAMDVLALPSYREGFGVVNIEAAAMGLPVVATRVAGVVDAVVDGVTGTLVPPYDAAALADAVSAYLSDPDLRRRHGAAGRARALQNFRPEAIWEALYGEYEQLLNAQTRRQGNRL